MNKSVCFAIRPRSQMGAILVRCFSVESPKLDKDSYKLVIVGGGSGGIAMSAKLSRKIGAKNIAIIEPAKYHYYQPGWTLVGSGLKKADSMRKEEKDLIPNGVDWLQTQVSSFDPDNNSVELKNGKKIKYDYMIVATGIYTNFDGIKGLREALENDEKVVSNFSAEYVKKTFPMIEKVKEGNAIFTFPMPPLKCPGAPQKIMYMAEDYFRRNGVRDKVNVMYHTSLPVIFGVKKYAASLMKVVQKKDIQLSTRSNLVEVDYKNNLAIFEKLDEPGTFSKLNYSMLHVAPPMKPVDEVKNSKLADQTGFVDVYKETLQHKKYPNVYAIGDCTNLPTSKTAAAVAAQSPILLKNLCNTMFGTSKQVPKYDGYTSCPLVTGYGRGILAEFDFDGNPLETFPIDQGKEMWIMYHMKKDVMPFLYWTAMMRGLWNGPRFYRKAFRLDFSKN